MIQGQMHRLLDVGTGDGTWLIKIYDGIRSKIGFNNLLVEALDPYPNERLISICKNEGIKLIKSKIEYANLKPNFYDVINVTHSAYYFDDLCLAFENMKKALNKNGLLIVTLVSKRCILNRLTEEINRRKGIEPMNATTFLECECIQDKLCLVDKLLIDHFFNRSYFLSDNKNLLSLHCILSRKFANIQFYADELHLFRLFLERQKSVDRQNTIMVFKK